MDRPDLSPSYRRSRLSALRGFSQWLAAEEITLPTSPRVLALRAEGVPKRLQPDEVKRLVHTAGSDQRTMRIVMLMLQDGLRRSEVARLDVEDVDFVERSILIRGKGGQGQHTAALPLSAEPGVCCGPTYSRRAIAVGRCS